jgi:hypothetical protein
VTSPCGVYRTCVPVRGFRGAAAPKPGADWRCGGRQAAPGAYFAAGLALACFGFFGVLAFLSTDASRSLTGMERADATPIPRREL